MDEDGTYVIGREMAAAHEAEARRHAGHPPASPLPPGRYDAARGESGTFAIESTPDDAALSAFAREYRAADAPRRARLRDGVGLDDAYRLLAFARRASVFALRSGDGDLVDDGLAACAAIGYERIDVRDGLVALALLHHAAVRCGLDPVDRMRAAGRLGEAAFSELVDGFLVRPEGDRDLRRSWGFTEVEGPHGHGLLASGFERWEPSVDLVGISLGVAAALGGDDYRIEEPMLAVELPAIWLSAAGDPGLDSILARTRATAIVHGHHEPAPPEVQRQQLLSAWILEAADPVDADRLAKLARMPRPGDALLGLADGAVFALVVARSVVSGVPALEDRGRLARFEPRLRAALRA